MENTINLLKEKCDNNEQYSRRTSVRIVDIPVPGESESAIDCTNKVKEVINESAADLSDECIDRAHRVGRIQVDENGSKKQAMVVKFTSGKHRTRLYRHRKNLENVKVYLDLTKNRFSLLKKCQPMVNGGFSFSVVNCNLCVRLKNGKFEYSVMKNSLKVFYINCINSDEYAGS